MGQKGTLSNYSLQHRTALAVDKMKREQKESVFPALSALANEGHGDEIRTPDPGKLRLESQCQTKPCSRAKLVASHPFADDSASTFTFLVGCSIASL